MQRFCSHGSFRIGNLRDKEDLGNSKWRTALPGFRKQDRVRKTAGLQGACGGYEKGVAVDDGERRRSTTTIPK